MREVFDERQGRLVKETPWTGLLFLVCAPCGEVNPHINLLVADVAQQQCGNPHANRRGKELDTKKVV